MVSTQLKNISQFWNLPRIGVKIKNLWNHHLVINWWDWFFEDSLRWFFPPPRLPPFRVLGSGVPFWQHLEIQIAALLEKKKVKHQPYPSVSFGHALNARAFKTPNVTLGMVIWFWGNGPNQLEFQGPRKHQFDQRFFYIFGKYAKNACTCSP